MDVNTSNLFNDHFNYNFWGSNLVISHRWNKQSKRAADRRASKASV